MKDIFKTYFGGNKFRWFLLAVVSVGLFTGLVLVKWNQDIRREAATLTAVYSFSTSTIKVVPGSNFSVSIILATGGQGIVGSDVLVRLDNTRHRLVTMNKSTNTSFNNIFKTYAPIKTDCSFDTAKVVNTANTSGLIEFGVVAFDPVDTNCTSTPSSNGSLTGTFNGTANVASLTFEAKPAVGDSVIRYVPSNGYSDTGYTSTTDSNVVIAQTSANPEDILQTPSSVVTVSYCYDFAGGSSVNIGDIQLVAAGYGHTPTTPSTKYQARFDLNNNQRIDIGDIQPVAGQYGKSCI